MRNVIASIIRKFHRTLDNENGFTLIEAVATIAIVGIIVTPIAAVFQVSLQSAIEARTQLKVNQLGQQYTEAIEVMDFTTLKALSDANVDIDGTNYGTYNLPELLDGYTVEINMLTGTSDTGFNDSDFNQEVSGTPTYKYQLKTDGNASVDQIQSGLYPYDMFVEFDWDEVNSKDIINCYEFTDSGTTNPIDHITNPSLSPDETVDVDSSDYAIEFDEHAGSMRVTLKRHNGVDATTNVSQHVSTTPMSDTTGKYGISLYFNNISLSEVTFHTTNSTSKDVQVNIYKSSSENVNPVVNLEGGSVIVNRGLTFYGDLNNTHRLYEVEIIVKDDSDTEVSRIVTTVLAR